MKQQFAFQNKTSRMIVTFSSTEGLTQKELLAYINKKYQKNFTKVINMKGKHICKYCGGIADGTDADTLCSECQEVFGHSRYSQL